MIGELTGLQLKSRGRNARRTRELRKRSLARRRLLRLEPLENRYLLAAVTVPFDLEVVASDMLGAFSFPDMTSAGGPFQQVNGGVITINSLPDDFTNAIGWLEERGASPSAPDLTLRFGSETQISGTLDNVLQLDRYDAGQVSSDTPVVQYYGPAADNVAKLYFDHGGAGQELLANARFVSLTVTGDPNGPNPLNIATTAVGTMQFTSFEAGAGAFQTDVAQLTGGTNQFTIDTPNAWGYHGTNPGSDPSRFRATGGIATFESPSLSLSITAASVSEAAGAAATTGTVSRDDEDLTSSLTVTLESNDTTEATVPATVVIPANQASATFDIAAVDDALVDGAQTATISASADGYTGASATLQVTDDDTATLTLTIAAASISENGGSTQATIQRTSGTVGALAVTLSSDDTTEAQVPASVTIPDGSASTTFTITGVDDTVVDGTQTVRITASATGFTAGDDTVDVTDDDAPSRTVFENALGLLTINEPQQGDRELTLYGSMTVDVQYEGASGAAADDTGNNLDEVQQQLTSLQLVGLGGGTDLIQVSLGANPSTGQIEETTDQQTGLLDVSPYGTGTANSFFDVFVQVRAGMGTLFNVDPIRLQSVVHAAPAASGDVFEMVGTVDLYTGVPPNVFPTGRSISSLKIYPDPLLGSIRGQKWNDIDGDGERDPGENGVDGWVITLRDATNDVPIDGQKTYSKDINGDGRIDPRTEQGLFHFQNVPPRKLTVSEIIQPGWGQTHPDFAAPVVPVDLGPGDNWIAGMPALTETVVVDGLLRLDRDLNGTEDEVVAVTGSATVMMSEARESLAGSGKLDLVQAEIVQLELAGLLESGQTIQIGGGDGNGDLANSGPLHSPGQFQQQANNPLWVDSSFNVALAVQLADVAGNQIHLAPEAGLSLQMRGAHDRFPIDGQPLLSQNQVVLVEGTTQRMQILGLDVIAYDRTEQLAAQSYHIRPFPQGQNLTGFDFANIDYASVVPPAIATDGDWALHVGPANFPGNPNPVGVFFWGTESNEIPINHMHQQWFWYRIGDEGPERSLDNLTLVSAEAQGNTINLTYGDPAVNDPVRVQIAYQLTGTSGTQSTIRETVTVTNLGTGPIDFHWIEYTDIDADADFGPSFDTAARTGPDQITQTGPLGTRIVVDQATGIDLAHWQIAAHDQILQSLGDGASTTLADSDDLNGATANVTHAFQWQVSLTDQNPVEIYQKTKEAGTAEVVMPQPPAPAPDPTPGIFDFSVDVAPTEGPWWFDPAIAIGYDYRVTGNTFKSVTMPGGNYGGPYEISVPDGSGGYTQLTTLGADQTYNFPAGVSEFRLMGIDASAGIDAADGAGFPTGLTFVTAASAQVEQTGIPGTIYVDENGGLVEEADRSESLGVIQSGDLVTWRTSFADEQRGLVFGATAFDSLADAQTYRSSRNLAATTTIEEAPAISWQNSVNRFNVDGSEDGLATALDVLTVINYINANSPNSTLPAPPLPPPPYYDVNGDKACTAEDVLDLINHVNANSNPSGEGEGTGTAAAVLAAEPGPHNLVETWSSVQRTGQADILRPSASSDRATGMSPSSTDFVRASVNTRSLFSTIGARDQRESRNEIIDEFTVVESILPDIVEDIALTHVD